MWWNRFGPEFVTVFVVLAVDRSVIRHTVGKQIDVPKRISVETCPEKDILPLLLPPQLPSGVILSQCCTISCGTRQVEIVEAISNTNGSIFL